MSKKIGILTFHRSINNGAFLQCFSLANKLLENPEYSVEVINYDTQKMDRLYKKAIIKKRPLTPKSVYMRFAQYRSFRSILKYLPLSDFKIINNDYNVLFDKIKNRYDAIIVGSDAVWNWKLRGFPNAYWLGEDLGANLYSYAASVHGMDTFCVNDKQLNYCKKALDRFSFIGVRDTNTENFVKRINNSLQPVHTCDPTIFLDINKIPCDLEDLKGKLKRKYRMSFNRPIIGMMCQSEHVGRLIREKYADKYDIVALYKDNKYADVFLYDLTPFEWGRVFSFFDLTISQYFHGTLLSLKNGTPVIAADMWEQKEGVKNKIEDVLLRMGLEDAYFNSYLLDEETVERMYELCDKYLKSPPKDRIRKGIEKESKTKDAFFEKLKSDLIK